MNKSSPNSTPFLTIPTRRLLLRSPLPADVPALAVLFTDAANTEHEPASRRQGSNGTTTGGDEDDDDEAKAKREAELAAKRERYAQRVPAWAASAAEGTNAFLVVVLQDEGMGGDGDGDGSTATATTTTTTTATMDGQIIGMSGYNALFAREETHRGHSKIGHAGDGSGTATNAERSSTTPGKTTVKVADLGVMIHTPWRRKGYAGEALLAQLAFAFEDARIGADVIELTTAVANAPFRTLMARLGFKGLEREVEDEESEGGRAIRYEIWREEYAKVSGRRQV